MAKNNSTPTDRCTIIWIGLLVGLGFYAADIIIDVLVFRSGTFIEELLNPTFHEIWMRTSVLLVAVAFAIYVQLLLRREREASVGRQTVCNLLSFSLPRFTFSRMSLADLVQT